jgi:ribonucleoside-triphosphate reductase
LKDWAKQRANDCESRERDEEFHYLSFRLHDEFVKPYASKTPAWGFPMGAGNTLGEHSWVTKYSRLKANGAKERFHEGLRRVIEGMYSIQKDHTRRLRLPWDEAQAQLSAQEAYERVFSGKWSPPGRGLWMMGTEFVNGRNDSSALQNCGFISTHDVQNELSAPFSRLMNMSMLGVGVGFDTRGANQITLNYPDSDSGFTRTIEDSREGWCKSVEVLLDSYFISGRRRPVFDYKQIRAEGTPIMGFGGTSAGPEPLIKLHNRLRELLDNRAGELLTSTDIVDIMNMIGKCVVAANVRSSAEIALGDANDTAFLDLKDWEINPVRMGADGWGYTSNNSVIAESGQDYSHLAERMALNGEPGIIWLDVVRKYGRLADEPNNRDVRAMGVNPCGEQPLENNELCTLVETYPTHHDSMDDYLRTLKFAYLYGKSVTLLMTQWPETNAVMRRNARIGTSMTGLAQFVESRGWSELRAWQNAGYQAIRDWDKQYSEWLGVRESIKVTTVKPSGTVSLLFGVTPGCHWPRESGFYVRTVRENITNPIVEVMRNAGYPVEPSQMNPDTTVVITLPVEGPEMRSERDVSIWEKTHLAQLCQRYWSDNSVSVTVTFSEDEIPQIPALLSTFDGQLKSLSLMPMADGVYAQAPYQRVSREDWESLRANVKPIDWELLYSPDAGMNPAEGELYCTTDVCEIKR